MNALSTTTGCEDPVCMAYGREVKALLNARDPVSWTEDLWTIYTGFMPGRAGSHRRSSAMTRALPTPFVHSRSCCFSLKGLKKLYGRTTRRGQCLSFFIPIGIIVSASQTGR